MPITNHGLPCMSMGFLLPRSSPDAQSNTDTAVVWRGLMVQKAVQQLLFDVDWREQGGSGLDVLVLDMPPGTGDVPLTLGQLVVVDGEWSCVSRECLLRRNGQVLSLSRLRKMSLYPTYEKGSPCSKRFLCPYVRFSFRPRR